jgi:2-C-methyl-D-erythritol 4-phosphate cytidylyltransferase
MPVSAVILAGGQGERFGTKKQFVEFQGLPLWMHVYSKCNEALVDFERIVIVGVKQPHPMFPDNVVFMDRGGKTRQDSVFYGLHKIGEAERVVILEAARPLVSKEQIVTIAEDNHDSTSFVAPAVETIIYKGQHLDRQQCEILQVPQAFDSWRLIRAHMDTGLSDATDDTILMRQRWGIVPHLIPGGRNLHKVTYPHDIKVLEHIDEDLNNRW